MTTGCQPARKTVQSAPQTQLFSVWAAIYENGTDAAIRPHNLEPNQLNGQPCIRGMRLTVRRVVEAIALYPDRGDLFRNYPELEPDDIQQALAYAAANLEDSANESTAA